MADRLGRLLDPYLTAPPFVCFPLSDAPAPAPLPSTHHRQQVYLLVWCNLPSVASTGPIFKRRKIINFVMLLSGRDWRPHKSLKTSSNDTKSKMKRLLDLIYTGVSQVVWPCQGIGKIASPHHAHQRNQHDVDGNGARHVSERCMRITRSSGHNHCCCHRHRCRWRRGVRDWDCGMRRSPLRCPSSSSSPPGGAAETASSSSPPLHCHTCGPLSSHPHQWP